MCPVCKITDHFAFNHSLMIIQVNIVICNHCILLFLHKSTTNYYYWNLRINWQSVALLTRGWGKLETRPPVALGSSSALFTFTMSLAPLPGELENCARHAFKMAPRHHAFPQKRDSEAQPIWIDILVSHRCWQASKVGSRMANGNVVLQLAKSQRGGGEQVTVTATLYRSRLPE